MAKTVRVLICQRSAAKAQEIVAGLRQAGIEPYHRLVSTYDALGQAVADEPWDLILSDHAFGDFSVHTVIERLRATTRSVPVVVVAPSIGEERVAALMRAGAADYVVWGNWALLPAVIDRELKATAQRVERQKASEARMAAYATMEREIQKRSEELHKVNRLLRDEVIVRRQAEEAQAAISQRLAMTLRASNAGSWDLDLRNDTVTWSDEMKALYGMDPSQTTGSYNQRLEYVLPEDRGLVVAAREQAFKTGILDVQFRIRRHDTGEVRWLYSRGQVFFDDRLKPMRLAGISLDITERKALEDRLSAATQRLEAHLANSPLAIIEFAGDFSITRWTADAERIFGWTAAEVLGTKVTQLRWVYEDDVQQVAQLGREMRRSQGTNWVSTNRNYRKDGTVIYCEWYNSVIRDERGKLVSVLSQVLDITKRRQAELALQASLERIELAEHAAKIGFWNWDMTSEKLTWSNELFALFGLDTSAGATFDMWLSVVHPDDRDLAMNTVTRSVEEHQPLDNEYRVVLPDGQVRWISSWGNTYYDVAGKPLHMCGICSDITERKQTETALRWSEERYRSLFDTLIEGFCIVEVLFDADDHPVDYRFVEINPAFEKQTGLHDAQGKRMRELAQDHEEYWFEIYGRIALTGEPMRFENEAKALGRWYEVFAYRVGQPENRTVAILFNDITERKKAEESLRQAMVQLEARVAARTADLELSNRALLEQIVQRQRAQDLTQAERQLMNNVLETLPAYVILLTADYRVAFANHVFRERFGESHGRRCYEYLFDRNEPCDICETYKVFRTDAPARWEWTGPDGRIYDIYDFPFTDTDGTRLVLEMGIDITELKQAAADLRRHRDQLEEIVKERTEDLQSRNTQLAAEVMERTHAEEALRDSRHNMAEILESISDGFFSLQADWTFGYINHRAAENVGYAPEQLRGKNIWEMFPTIAGTEMESVYRKVMKERTAQQFEFTGLLTDKSYEISVYPSGESGISVYWVDVTGRRRAEEALRKSEARYRTLVKHAPAGIYEIDFHTQKFTSVNDAMCQLTGYSTEELLSMRASDILDEPGRALFQKRIHQWLAGEKPDEEVEYKVKTKDGRELYAMLHVTFTSDDHGTPIGATVVGYDVTERRRARLVLHESRQQLAMALSNPRLTVWRQDKDLRYIWLHNPRLGFVTDNVLGKTDFEIWEPEQADKLTAIKQRVLDTGAGAHQEIEVQRDGTRAKFDLTIEPLTDQTGAVIGISCISVELPRRSEHISIAPDESISDESSENRLDGLISGR